MRIATRDDIPFINRVLNDPTVRPYVFEGEEPLDIEPVFDYVLCYVSEHGVIFCEALGNARYMALVS